VSAGDTPGVDVVRAHKNVSDFRIGPGETLFYKFYDPSFAQVRKYVDPAFETGRLGLKEGERLEPEVFAANRRALEEQKALLQSNRIGRKPVTQRGSVLLGNGTHYWIAVPGDVRPSLLKFNHKSLSEPGYRARLTTKTVSASKGLSAGIASSLERWLNEGKRGKMTGTNQDGASMTIDWSVQDEHAADVIVSVAVMAFQDVESLRAFEIFSL
jgi:hypothetical protein